MYEDVIQSVTPVMKMPVIRNVSRVQRPRSREQHSGRGQLKPLLLLSGASATVAVDL